VSVIDVYTPERHLTLEGLNPSTFEGFAIGDRVSITRRLAEDVDAGAVAIVTDIDDHPVYPLTVTVQRPAGQDIKGLPVAVEEVAVLP
jgi:hypothetical protein